MMKGQQLFVFLGGSGVYAFSAIALIAGAALIYPQHQVGIISMVIAMQFMLSQISSFGIHFSTLYHSSNTSIAQISPLHGLVNVLLSAIVVAGLFILVFPWVVNSFYPSELLDFMPHLTAYAVLAACNKVFMAELNAKGRFSSLGMLLMVKGLFTLTAIAFFLINSWEIHLYVLVSVLIPEILIAITFIVYALNHRLPFQTDMAFTLFVRDFRFGAKSFWGVIFLESSTKVDILLLGALTDLRTTGIYTFVALSSDIFLQYTGLIRSYFNPLITKKYLSMGRQDFRGFIWKLLKRSYALVVPFTLMLCMAFWLIIVKVPDYSEYVDGIGALLILSVFLTCCAGFFPLLQTFGQTGRPLLQSTTFALLFIINLAFNAILIPYFGMNGAAIATGLSYAIYSGIFILILKRDP